MDPKVTPEESLATAKDISSTDSVNLAAAAEYLQSCHPDKYPTVADAAAAITGDAKPAEVSPADVPPADTPADVSPVEVPPAE